MRDIIEYQRLYVDEPFSRVQVSFRRKKVIELLNKASHRNILEVGCGIEPLYKFFDDYDKMVIVEPSPDFWNYANANAPEKVTCVYGYIENSIEKVRELNISFDYIIVSSLLHEVEEPGKLLYSIKLLCNKKTIVHINVPNAKSLHRLLAFEMGLIEDIHQKSEQQVLMQRRRVYDIDILKEAVEKDFIVEECGSYFLKPFTHMQMQTMLEQNLIDERILNGLYNMDKYLPDFGSEIFVQLRRR